MDAAIFGNIVADVIGEPIDLRHPPKPGGLFQINSISLVTGGNVCNVGIAMSRLGMKVAATGLVGEDILGRALLERLRDEGLDVTGVQSTPKEQTSASVVAVEPGGERTFYHSPGVTALLDANAFRNCFEVFRKCAWVQIAYFGLLPGITRELPQLLVELKQTAPGAKIAFDTLNPPADPSLLEPILPHLDLFAPSRPEAEILSGKRTPQEMVEHFRKHMKSGIIGIKLDCEGCYLDDGTQAGMIPQYPIKVIDSTGAGDAWFAGLLAGLRQKMTLEECGKLANRVAADCCTALGASEGIRSLKDTLSRL